MPKKMYHIRTKNYNQSKETIYTEKNALKI